MSLKSQQVTKEATAKRVQAAPAVKNRVRGSAGNHTLGMWVGRDAISGQLRATGGGQPKLTVSTPGDRYEQQADRVASQVMRMAEPQQPTSYDDGKVPPIGRAQTRRVGANKSGATLAPTVVHEVLRSSGQPLDPTTREFMESRFSQDFSRVRTHTSAQAAETAQGIGARAYTVGYNIVFGPGQYSPDVGTGKRLLAHELAHVIQQTARSQSPEARSVGGVVLGQTSGMLNRWFDLGYTSWTTNFGTAVVHHWVGTEQEWREVLKDADNDETYKTYLEGFLSLINNPELVYQTQHQFGWPNFVNTITRAPNHDEIMAFMRALYGLASELDLTPVPFSENYFLNSILKSELRGVIEKYQGDLLREISMKNPVKGSSIVVDDQGFKAVASEGEFEVSNSMINSAIHSSQEAVARLIVASAKNDDAAKDKAETLVINAAKVIRFTIDVQKARLARIEEMNSLVLDVIFDDILQLKKIPFVKAITEKLPAITSHLTKTANQMASSAMVSGDPDKQILDIDRTFIDHVKQLGPNGLNVLNEDDTNDLISLFGSALGAK